MGVGKRAGQTEKKMLNVKEMSDGDLAAVAFNLENTIVYGKPTRRHRNNLRDIRIEQAVRAQVNGDYFKQMLATAQI